MISRRTTYFADNDWILPKNVWLKYQVFEKQKLRNKLCQMHYANKSFLMVYVGLYDCYENMKTYNKKIIFKFNYIL